MKKAHQRERAGVWVLLVLLMAALTAACIVGSDAGFKSALRARATAQATWPLGITTVEAAEDIVVSGTVKSVQRGLDPTGQFVGYLVTVTGDGQGAMTCTVVISADGKTLGGVRAVKGSTAGRYYNIRASLPYFTNQFEEVTLPIDQNGVDAASGATGSSAAVVQNVLDAAAFVANLGN